MVYYTALGDITLLFKSQGKPGWVPLPITINQRAGPDKTSGELPTATLELQYIAYNIGFPTPITDIIPAPNGDTRTTVHSLQYRISYTHYGHNSPNRAKNKAFSLNDT